MRLERVDFSWPELLMGVASTQHNDYAQGAASTQYKTYVNRLLSRAGLGQTEESPISPRDESHD
jgi:hypothetical protein